MKNFDLIIIGGGPGGYSAALSAAEGGLCVALFEYDRLGGTCLNRGCIPTKYLLDKAACLEKIRALTEEGIFRDAGSFSFRAIMKQKNKLVEKMASGIDSLMKSKKITVINSTARLLTAKSVSDADGNLYGAENVIIATGSLPAKPSIEGIEFALDSTEILDIRKIPKSLVIIGGGVIGLEFASAFSAFGAKVTVLEAMPKLLAGELPQAADLLLSELAKKGIDFKTSCKVEKITDGEDGKTVFFATEDGNTQTICADTVLCAVGRKPRLDGIDTKALGIITGARGEIVTDDAMRTSLDGVYAIGDVAGGYQLAHAAYAEADIAVADILNSRSEDGKSRYAVRKKPDCFSIPRCIYTLPALASVGISSTTAAGFTDIKVGRSSYGVNGMACAEGAAQGCVFVVSGRSIGKSAENDRITLGVTVVGANAYELIAAGGMATAGEFGAKEWQDLIFAHPTLSEMLKESAKSAF